MREEVKRDASQTQDFQNKRLCKGEGGKKPKHYASETLLV